MADTYINTFDPNYKPQPGGYINTFDPNYQPPKPRGMVGAFGAGVKETVGQAAQAAGKLTGVTGVEQWGREVRANAAPVGEESTGAAVARAAGGLVGWLPAIAGTLAVIPEAPELALGGAALRGMAGMALPAAANKVTTTSDLEDKGVDKSTAEKAGWASAATTAATGAVPLAMAGGLLKRAATGAVSGLVVGEASREAQNAVLVEHPELQTMVAGKDMVVNSVVGAMLGGIMGPRPIKTEIANMKAQAEADVAQGAPTEKPVTPAPEVASEVTPAPEQRPAGSFGQMNEFANLAEQEKADLEHRRTSIARDQEATAAQWRATKLASDIESTDNRVETARLQQQATDRQNLMDAIYSDPKERTPGMTFLAALEREYPNKPDPTPQEKAMIAKRESAYQAFNSKAMDIAPSTPNELILPAAEKGAAKPLQGVTGDRARGVKDVTNMWDAVLKENEGATSSIKAQHIAEVVKGKATITEQLAGIAELRAKKSTGTDNKALLDQLSAKLSKFRTSGYTSRTEEEGVKVNEEAAQAKPREAKQPEASTTESPWQRREREKLTKPDETAKIESNIPKDQSKVAAEIAALHAEANRLAEAGDLEGAQRTAHRAMVKIVEAGADYQNHLLDEHSNKMGEAFRSGASAGKAVNPATHEQINAEMAKLLGSKESADRLVVHVTDPEKQIPAKGLKGLRYLESMENKPTAAFAYGGKVYIMDGMIEVGHERGVILHEIGVHMGMENLIGKSNFSKLAAQIDDWAAGNGHLADIAIARKAKQSVAEQGVPADQIKQETVAYFVHHAVEAGIDPTHLEGQAQSGALVWLRKIWSAMKTALSRLGLDPASLKAQDIVDLAHAAAVAHAEGIPGTAKETTDFKTPAVLRSGFSTPVSAAKTVDTVLTKATSLWDSLKPAIQRTHLNWSQLSHITDMYEHLVPRLAAWGEKAINPLRDFSDNVLKSDSMATGFNHTTRTIHSQMEGLAPKQKEALFELTGKYQLAKIFPNKKYSDLELKTMSSADKQLLREAKQLYVQPGVKDAYDAANAQGKLLHEVRMASMLRQMGQMWNVPEHLWRDIDVHKGMSDEVTNLLNHVGLDVNGKRLKKQPKDMDQMLQTHVAEAMAMHETKKSESYFHIGRDGDYMVNFHIKDTPEAHAAVQKALSAAGVKDSIVVNPGDTHVFSMFETMNQMLAVTKQLDTIKQHLEPKVGTDSEGKPTASPYTAGLKVAKLRELDSSAPSFIRGMMAKLDDSPYLNGSDPELIKQKEAQKELLRNMYISMLPESSSSKLYARRTGTPGYSSDMAASFAKGAALQANFIALHATRPEQNVAMARIREAISALGDAGSPHFDLHRQAALVRVLNELNQRTANTMSPVHTPVFDMASALGHTFYLSASPGFILQNLAQPYQLTLPYLGGRHGFMPSFNEIRKAAGDAGTILKDVIQQGYQKGGWTGIVDATIAVDRAEHLTAGERDLLKHLIGNGRVEGTQGGNLTHITEGSNPKVDLALRIANSASYYGEVLNRIQTGLAAYRLEMKRSNDIDRAKDYATRAIDDTQINYAAANKARAIGKHGFLHGATPLVMAFQQFNLGVLQTLSKLTMQAIAHIPEGLSGSELEAAKQYRMEAVKSLAGILSATGVAAGTMGLPFAGVVMGAYNALAGDENHPVDAKTDYQNFLSDVMGHDAAQVVSHGAMNYLSGADMASKLGQENVIPFTGLFSQLMDSRQPLKDRINSGALSFMGPVVNGGSSVLQGLGKIADGDTMKGLEQMSPAMTKGAIKAVDMANNGFTDSKGIPLPMEATSWDTAVQAAGFTPTKLSTQREAQQGVNATQNALKMQEHNLANRFVAAVEAHDIEARQQVMADAKEFMRANPGMKVDFAGAMRRRAQETAIARVTGGVKGRSSQISMIEQQTRFAQP